MEKPNFNPLDVKINGSNLIEANAGTGKTYNITAIYTRMITELQFPVESILVVTYTNAAVSDMKKKIYERLQSVLDSMLQLKDGLEISNQDFSGDYAIHRKSHLDSDIKLLKGAIRDFDQNSVFTIHGFCQRMLKENAFSGKVAFDVNMTGDPREIIKRPIYDFWRKTAYSAHPSVMELILKFNPEDMINFYRQVMSNQSVEITEPNKNADEDSIHEIQNKLTECLAAVKEIYRSDYDEIHKLMDSSRPDFPLNKSTYSKKNIPLSFNELERLIDEQDVHCPLASDNKKIHRFTNESIIQAEKTGIITHPLFDKISEWHEAEKTFRILKDSFMENLRYRLCRYMDEVLEKHKSERNFQSYDDLISRMRSAVTENYGHSSMTASINRKYMAALIDEFQDTDPYQYDIFETVFAKNNKPFFMIGDPKQAIYSFRGADVFAYLKAATANSKKFTLTKNFRSDKDLVEAINTLFDNDNSFMLEQIEYSPSKGALGDVKVSVEGQQMSPLTIWDCGNVSADDISVATARSIAELLNKAESGNAVIDGRKIQPSDIAILCRRNPQMAKVKRALDECRIPSVVSGSKSVFESDEAKELANILKAVISPFSRRYIKTALATTIFGYNSNEIYNIADTDEWDDISEEFRIYNDLLNLKGFAPMFFRLINNRKVYNRLAKLKPGERKLTNFIHLAELVQKFEAEKKASPIDILRFLTEKITSPETRDDEAELKMDSDENAVTIITIHKSKGLEYNIVYTPFLMFKPSGGKVVKFPKYHKDERFIMDISNSDESKELAKIEEQAEDIRIAYVALTRAKAACFTAWGNTRNVSNTAISHLINKKHSGYDNASLYALKSELIDITPMPETIIQTFQGSKHKPEKVQREFSGTITQPWQINSFSRLVHSAANAKDTDQYTAVREETLSNIFNIFTFPKGAKAGTCLHECMEEIRFEDINPIEITELVESKLALYSFDTDFTPAVYQNIESIVYKDMNGIKLADLQTGEYVPELEFQMKTDAFTSEDITDIFTKCGEHDFAKAASTLSFSTLEGFMNGFADLIFCSKGKFYVLDWKSNHLGMDISDYSYEKMHSEMLGSHYYLQMYIYTLALHLHLKKSLPNYSYEDNIGGGFYLFMRGINSSSDEGIYFHRPSAQAILEMEKLVQK